LDAGARMAGISVDPVEANAGVVARLQLPFLLLSDPGGEGAIQPYDLWNAEERGGIAKPAVVVIDTAGEERFRTVSRDFADRLHEDDVVAAVRDLGLPPTTQEPPAPGTPDETRRVLTVEALPVYFRGARFAARAVSLRVPDARDEADALIAEVDRYGEAVRRLRSRTR
jgi:hypothetical protein